MLVLSTGMLVLSTGMMITAELFNTAIEAICDFMKTDYDMEIGIIKDVAAAATGVAIFVWVLVVVIKIVEIWSYLAIYL